MRVLLVTNDWRPRVGGIETYLWNLYRRLPSDGVEVRVLCPVEPGGGEVDAASALETVRFEGGMAWPVPALRRRVHELSRDVDVIAFGSVLPSNLVARGLGLPTVVHTHANEVAMARTPPSRALLRAVGRFATLVTYVSEFARRRVAPAMGEGPRTQMLRTGVDLGLFHPNVDGTEVRKRYGLGDRPLVVSVSRLVPRKGQDLLVRAMPAVTRAVPDAALLVVGDGPISRRLGARVVSAGLEDRVFFAGSKTEAELPVHYAAGNLFALPCRTRLAGFDVEGLPVVYSEAAASGLPSIAGDSGGAPEAIEPGRTGLVVPGRDVAALAVAVARLLGDREEAERMGVAAREMVEEHWNWDRNAAAYARMLASAVA